MRTDRVAPLYINYAPLSIGKLVCAMGTEEGEGGGRLYRTNEGDGIRTKSAREGGRERGPVPDLPLSRLRARLLKSHRRNNIPRGYYIVIYFFSYYIKDSNLS